MEFRILGPLEVVRNGESIILGPPQQRELLALLLVNANRVVTTDRILEELWGEDADGKENSLWVYVSRLRSVLEPDRTERSRSSVLITRDHGYLLRLEPESLDAHHFERAAAEGRALVRDDPALASEILAESLQLWRGSALEEFAYSEFAQVEIKRLESLRLMAIENRIEADLRRGMSGELVGELEALRSQYPMQERFVGQLMLALYQSGRQAEALRAFERYRREIGEEMGLEPSPELCRLEEQVLLHDSGIRLRIPRIERLETATRALRNPFKGLRPFYEDDSPDFFGRDRLVSDVVRRINGGGRLVALVGPSGSGKSSVLRAGIIPALLKSHGGDSESKSWRIALMVPGARPFAELEAALLRSSLDAPDSLGEQLTDPVTGVLRACLRLIPDEHTRLLIAVDQFEELFTLADEDERVRFISNLLPVVNDPHGRVTVVLTLRADFYDQPLAFPEFANRLSDGVVNVPPLAPDELEEAAQKPVENVGVFLTPSLLAALLTDVVGRHGSLPLFQYALTDLYDRRTGESLTLDAYRAMDGLNGVLRGKADDLYASLRPDQQVIARQLFPRLVTISENGEWGRRRVPASEIVSLGLDLVAVQAVVDVFGENRLLTLDRDAVTGSPTVEVSHEALLTEWTLLRGWIEESREDLRRLAILASEVTEWLEADRDPVLLPTGPRLDRYEQWAAASSLHLTTVQGEFIDRAIEIREQTARIESEQARQVERREQRVRRRLWALLAGVVVIVGASVSLFLIGNEPELFDVAVIAPSVLPYESSLVATGVARAERELPVSVDFRQRVTDLEQEYRDLAEQGTDLIFIDPGNSGWGYVAELIADYPDTAFAVVDGVVPPAGALSTFVADEEAGYMGGLAAGLMTQTGVVGFVGAKHQELTDYWRAGFEAGVRAVDPGIEILAIHIGTDNFTFQDVAGANEAARLLFEQDADVVLAVAEDANLGVIESAFEHSQSSGVWRWVIGSGSDWSNEVANHLRPHVLTSALKKWDVAMFETIRTFTEGRFEPGIEILTLSDGAVGLAKSVHLSDDLLERISELSSDVAGGILAVPRVPSKVLLPPPNLIVSHEATVEWDGQNCSYVGDSTGLNAGEGMRVEFVNLTGDFRQFWATHRGSQSFNVAVSTLVGPMGRSRAYIALGTGNLEINCGPDLRAGQAVRPVNAVALTID